MSGITGGLVGIDRILGKFREFPGRAMGRDVGRRPRIDRGQGGGIERGEVVGELPSGDFQGTQSRDFHLLIEKQLRSQRAANRPTVSRDSSCGCVLVATCKHPGLGSPVVDNAYATEKLCTISDLLKARAVTDALLSRLVESAPEQEGDDAVGVSVSRKAGGPRTKD